MKWSEFKRKARDKKCKKVGEGGNHEHWRGPNGKFKNFSRHNDEDVPKKTLHDICKAFGITLD